MNRSPASYILTKWWLQRGLALVYGIGFVAAAQQFVPLLGEHGLLPIPDYIQQVSFWNSPSLFYFWPTDGAFLTAAWIGVGLAVLALLGISERFGNKVAAVIWTLLWLLYLSFVNVGQIFYSFGWESLLLEAGFFGIFLAAARRPSLVLIWFYRWLLFRLMFGAGLIKLRGDSCWRDFTCLFYHYETQPMPNPLSWYFHWLPQWVHQASVGVNHVMELIVPVLYFLWRRVAAVAGVITIVFQTWLMVSGNFSFLNLLTIVIALSLFDDQWLGRRAAQPKAARPYRPAATEIFLIAAMAMLSLWPVLNLLSPYQAMNQIHNPLHLVNSYGAFGTITRPRYEVIIEGTSDSVISAHSVWKEYNFIGKPGDVARRPPQIAPYHLRLDWLMWFAAFSSYQEEPWFVPFIKKLLQSDAATLALLANNPFLDQPPHYIRAQLYRYEFTTPTEHSLTGQWWNRQYVGEYLPPVSL